MANLFEGIFHTVQGLLQSVLAVIQACFNIVLSAINGVFTFVWGLFETFADFVGASAHFVASNFLVLGLLIVAYIVYVNRKTPGAVGQQSKKKVQ